VEENIDSLHKDTRKLPISQRFLQDLLPGSLYSSPVVSIKTTDLVTEATNLLPHHLESFTDSLVVTEDEIPIGIVGGIEILDGILGNPNVSFFEKTQIKEIMSKKLIILNKDTTLGELLRQWMQTRRAFAIMPNQYHGYSVISARKLLEVGMSCKMRLKVKDISTRKIITFGKKQTVKEIITSMFENKTRKLILEGTSKFISDRIIIQKIARDLHCLRGVDNFLEMKADIFQLDDARKVSDQLTMGEACKVLYEMQSPYLLFSTGVVTPWDVITSLNSEQIIEYD
jgi:predicted transcriptional regulator